MVKIGDKLWVHSISCKTTAYLGNSAFTIECVPVIVKSVSREFIKVSLFDLLKGKLITIDLDAEECHMPVRVSDIHIVKIQLWSTANILTPTVQKYFYSHFINAATAAKVDYSVIKFMEEHFNFLSHVR